MESLLDQVGGAKFVNRTVSEFYGAISHHLSTYETCDFRKQLSRQAQFLNHALSTTPEPDRTSRASFLARGLNPELFDAMLDYFEGQLLELGYPSELCSHLVSTASGLYGGCEQDLSIAC
ncbi:hypothetical protein MO867_02860 [Microbulbifer sp. OS29]|uniref:Uncharacterized protein n=1 Tax=Microbulbifer okhotskensis TaxID=2926617 RepID=A0A9X2EJA5_9GAMM|nr:hypothetical protein [Microbulbifer okhotskensis]MCO1333272.1 hypothetical protein [Microbulbifer okhotskensis]